MVRIRPLFYPNECFDDEELPFFTNPCLPACLPACLNNENNKVWNEILQHKITVYRLKLIPFVYIDN